MHRIKIDHLRNLTFLDVCFFSLALTSFLYAVVTAPDRGVDLILFYNGARNWVAGTYQAGVWPIGLYPPFALPMFAPLALFSFEVLLIVFLIANIAAIPLTLHLTFKLFGGDWALKPRLYLAALLLSWAPLRVTLRNGQITLFITALLLGALLARRSKKQVVSGLLLGITLVKYPVTFPFVLYVAWKREWKLFAATFLLPIALTPVYAARLGLTPWEAVRRYIDLMTDLHVNVSGWMGTTEIKLLIVSLTGGNVSLAGFISVALAVAALLSMAFLFARAPAHENIHFSLLSLFALWSSYHRTYDAVICILPAALLIDFLVRKRFVAFSRLWLVGLGFFIISIPGLLTERLKLDPTIVSANPLGWLGLHIERLIIFGLFCSLMGLLWKPDVPVATPDAARV